MFGQKSKRGQKAQKDDCRTDEAGQSARCTGRYGAMAHMDEAFQTSLRIRSQNGESRCSLSSGYDVWLWLQHRPLAAGPVALGTSPQLRLGTSDP